MKSFLKRQSPARLIALGFAALIALGSLLLILPCSIKDGMSVRYIDALYTSASAVCVTGLVTVDPGDTFTPLGQFFIAVLIQIGGLGVTTMGAGVMLAIRKRVDLKSRTLVREAMNVGSSGGIVALLRRIFGVTVAIELIGAVLSFFVFSKQFPLPDAIGISLFHSVASFNNSGFDIFGGGQSLIPYYGNIPLNLITMALIILGGIGFLVMHEIWECRFSFKKFSMHTKTVLTVSLALTVIGAILMKISENITWLGAFFASVTARTAGFSTYSFGNFTSAGLAVMLVLMVIGASPGSTAGGIKTTTFFAVLLGIKSSATNESEHAFKYTMPREAFKKASAILLLAVGVITVGTYFMCILEPDLPFEDILFEITSAFGTVGLTRGITPMLKTPAKLLSMFIMYIGRLGPLTVATLWYFSKGERVRYPDGNISIG